MVHNDIVSPKWFKLQGALFIYSSFLTSRGATSVWNGLQVDTFMKYNFGGKINSGGTYLYYDSWQFIVGRYVTYFKKTSLQDATYFLRSLWCSCQWDSSEWSQVQLLAQSSLWFYNFYIGSYLVWWKTTAAQRFGVPVRSCVVTVRGYV